MKKYIALILTVAICFCFVSCKNTEEADTTSATSSTQQVSTTKALPEVSTTAKATSDTAKAKSLKNAIVNSLSLEGSDVAVNDDGSFQYKCSTTDESTMYSQEYSDEKAQEVYDDIDTLVDGIKSNYADSDSIELYSKDNQQINYSDNGIDSVIYVATYINSQNQAMTIYADSTGKIYYIDCDFTW